MFPWWMRFFIFLPLAALQIVLLTISALGWQYEVGFERFMILLGDRVSSALQLNLIEAVIRDVLASWDIVLPELGRHWHHVFVLMWILLSPLARFAGQSEFSGPTTSAPIAFGLFLFAGVCSFVPSFAVGLMPGHSLALLYWPFAGFLAFTAAAVLFRGHEGDVENAGKFCYAAAVIATIGFLGSNGLGIPQLELLVALVFGVGILFLGVWLLGGEGPIWQRLQNQGAAMGLDILGPFALAATLAWMFGKYMPV